MPKSKNLKKCFVWWKGSNIFQYFDNSVTDDGKIVGPRKSMASIVHETSARLRHVTVPGCWLATAVFKTWLWSRHRKWLGVWAVSRAQGQQPGRDRGRLPFLPGEILPGPVRQPGCGAGVREIRNKIRLRWWWWMLMMTCRVRNDNWSVMLTLNLQLHKTVTSIMLW